MAHALCLVVDLRLRHILVIFNTYCFPTVTVVTGTRLSVTFERRLSVLLVTALVWDLTLL